MVDDKFVPKICHGLKKLGRNLANLCSLEKSSWDIFSVNADTDSNVKDPLNRDTWLRFIALELRIFR